MATVRDIWVRCALGLALALPVYFLTAALGVKFGMLDWRLAFGQMTLQWGPLLLLGVLAFAVVGLLLALLVGRPRRGRRIALAAMVPPLAGVAFAAFTIAQTQGIPPIHDISTDLLDPPAFSAATLAERATTPGGNGADLEVERVPKTPTGRFGKAEGRLARELQVEAYPDIQPVRLTASAQEATKIAEAAARRLGLSVVHVDAQAGTVEAVQRSFWYGFADDVVVRVRAAPGGTGSVVDIRSSSRVGVSDLGVNAKRIRALRDAIAAAG